MYQFTNDKVYSFKYSNSLDHEDRLVLVTESDEKGVKGYDLSVDDGGSTFRNFKQHYIDNVKEVPHSELDTNLLPNNIDLSLIMEGYEEDDKLVHLLDNVLYIVDPDDVPKPTPDFYADTENGGSVLFILNGKHLELFNDGSIYYEEENRPLAMKEFVAEINKIKI